MMKNSLLPCSTSCFTTPSRISIPDSWRKSVTSGVTFLIKTPVCMISKTRFSKQFQISSQDSKPKNLKQTLWLNSQLSPDQEEEDSQTEEEANQETSHEVNPTEDFSSHAEFAKLLGPHPMSTTVTMSHNVTDGLKKMWRTWESWCARWRWNLRCSLTVLVTLNRVKID